MTWEKAASDKLESLVQVIRDPFRTIIKNNAQMHAEIFATHRKNPHVTVKEAVLGFLRARSHKLSAEGKLILTEHQLTEEDFSNYPKEAP